MVWLFSLGIALVYRFEKGKLFALCKKTGPIVLVTLGIVVWFFAQILNTPIITVYRFGIYGFCFLLGYFVFSHDKVTDRLSKYWLVLVISAVVLGIGYVYYYFGENYAMEPIVSSPFSVVYGWMAKLWLVCVSLFALINSGLLFEQIYRAFGPALLSAHRSGSFCGRFPFK